MLRGWVPAGGHHPVPGLGLADAEARSAGPGKQVCTPDGSDQVVIHIIVVPSGCTKPGSAFRKWAGGCPTSHLSVFLSKWIGALAPNKQA